MKSLQRMAFATATLASLVIGGAAHAQESINDPARDGYYETFKGKKVVFVPVFMGLDLTEGWSKMMAKQAEALGYSYEVRNSNFNTAAGAQTLTSLISEKPDVVVVQNPDVQSYARLLQRAEKADIRVIQLNMKTNTLTNGFVGADVVQLGELQAKAVANKCGAGTSGKVLILAGPPTSPFSAYMLKGYENILDIDEESYAAVGRTVRKLARAVVKAFDADGVTVQQFNEPAGGQVVFHLHVHIIPRFDGVRLKPHTGEMADFGVLAAHADKIRAALS